MSSRECDRIGLLITASLEGVITRAEERTLDRHLASCELCLETCVALRVGVFDDEVWDLGDETGDVERLMDRLLLDGPPEAHPPGTGMDHWSSPVALPAAEGDRAPRGAAPKLADGATKASHRRPAFGRYVSARTSRSKVVSAVLSASVAVHAAAVLALLFHGLWIVEPLAVPKSDVAIAIATPMPPHSRQIVPTEPLQPVAERFPARDEVRPTVTEPKKQLRSNPRQTNIVATNTATAIGFEPTGDDVGLIEENDDSLGRRSSSAGDEVIGIAGGRVEGLPEGLPDGLPGGGLGEPPLAPPPPTPPIIVPQVAVEAKRISGQRYLEPDQVTVARMTRDRRSQISVVARMCLTRQGTVSRVRIIQSSGYSDHDDKIRAQMQAWQFQPFVLDGHSVHVCTTVNFIYRRD